jgi:16S rRNA (guanine527-N7)-methyltransferase
LPLKIACPEIALTLLEATGKKSAFLAHVTNTIELPEVAIISGRAEEASHSPEHRERYDVVISRAVAELPTLLELTLPFCRVGGRVIAQKKGGIEEEVRQSSRALEVLGGGPPGIKEVSVPGLNDRRFLVVFTKVAPTPDSYPRRPGIPAKKPLI